jgi:hypothetical protein
MTPFQLSSSTLGRTVVPLALITLSSLGCRHESREPSVEREEPERLASPEMAAEVEPSTRRTAESAPESSSEPSADRTSDHAQTADVATADEPRDAGIPPVPDLPAATHRLLILLPDGPRLCDVQFVLDGHSLEQYVDDLTRDVLACADVDHDGDVSWQEITTAEPLKYGQFGNVRADNEDQRKQIVYRCDVNRNGRVDPAEIASFLAPSGAVSSWVHLADPPEANGATSDSVLFEWLDVDHDQQLDARDIENTPSRLRMLDRDDDGILTREDLPGRNALAESRIGNRGSTRRRGRSDIVRLQESSDWSRVLYLIEDRYAFGSPVQSDDLPRNQDLFRAVDTDGDGYWSVAEAPEFLRQPAELVLLIEFGGDSPALQADVQGESALSGHQVAAGQAQVSLPVDDSELIVRASETDVAVESQWEPLWPQWDSDGDESLDAKEYAAAEALLGLPLVAVDRNGDGRLQSIEGIDALRQRWRVQRARIQIELIPETEPLWRYLDASGDGRLSERELDAAPGQLSRLTSRSEVVTAKALPPMLSLRFHRGNPDAMANLAPPVPTASISPEAATSTGSAPRWFEQTDRNRDGEISRREFLGPPAMFEQLDQNADGMLQLDEVR